ncbi:MAG TPA: amylo-alpha-1,6-glucosidase [Candidatus Acidoferrum sp.]|nr:amylo-alpha-1,6-glucosidase [Candidatus Acidoferrum sp.]
MMTRRSAIKTATLAGVGLAFLPEVLAQTNSVPDLAHLSNAALAGRILADKTLAQVHRMARELLGKSLNAGSGYPDVWIRDMNTFIEVALEVNPPQRFRHALLTFCRLQGEDGNIVDGYYESAEPAKEDSSSIAGLNAYKNSVETDQESSLGQAVYKYITVTHDETILEERVAGIAVRERLARAMQFVLTQRFDPKHGLVWGGTTIDWGDIEPTGSVGSWLDARTHRALSIYDNAMLVIALNDYLKLPGVSASESRHWQTVRDELKHNIRKYLWDSKNRKFIPHVYLNGSPFPKDFDENAIYYHGGTAVAIEAGLLSHREVLHALERMEEDVRLSGAPSIGLTVYPPYPKGYFENPAVANPYTYQNAGDWCWFGGRMIQQLVAQGYVMEAYRDLQPMVERVVRTGDFNEWWSRDNQPSGSGNFRGSAGVLGKAIEMLQAWAQQHTR